MFRKVLIANRGEIAVRVMRACREMGIRTVAVFSDADRDALHVTYADEAYHIGPAPSVESYLQSDRILQAARTSGSAAIHPGYGFLSENPQFARACESAGFVFIGPGARAMELMGSKTDARRLVLGAGLPVVPGTSHDLLDPSQMKRAAATLGYPVMLKAASGGGGKGLRLALSEKEMEAALRAARSEAQNAFNDSSVYIEKYLERPRHIEVQILGDRHGHLIHLGERECSLQRRRQKLVEESPSPSIGEGLRQRICQTALDIARIAGYSSAGTVEFLLDRDGNFYFLEMNVRLQVEHPVTESVTGLDLVKAQILVAAGEPLSWRQEDVTCRGHAVECRICAEDPAQGFFPSPGLIRRLRVPAGPGVRDDSGVYEGWRVPLEYDPLLSKLVTWGSSRSDALARMGRALDEYEVMGIKTNIGFFRRLLQHPAFLGGDFDTEFIDRLLAEGFAAEEADAPLEAELMAVVAAALDLTRHSPRQQTKGRFESHWKDAGRGSLLNNQP